MENSIGKESKILLIDPSTTAGGGGINKINNLVGGLGEWEKPCDFDLISVGKVAGKEPIVSINYPEEIDVQGRYDLIKGYVAEAFALMMAEGYDTFVVLSRGYTAYGPQAVKECMKELNANGAECKAKVYILDSSFPDVDELDEDTSGRFYKGAYQSDENTEVIMMLNNGLVIPNYEEFPRRFGMEVIAVNQPFDKYYRRDLLDLRKMDRAQARQEAMQILDEVPGNNIPEDFKRDGVIVSVIANDGVFQPQNAGLDENYQPNGKSGWMKPEEFLQSVTRIKELVGALSSVAEAENRKIIVPLTETAWGIIKRELGELSKNLLIVNVLPIGPEKTYLKWLKGCDLAICRSTQAVTTIQAATMGVPVVICPMPGGKYMDSYLVDPLVEDLGIPYFDPSCTEEEIAMRLRELIIVPNEAAAVAVNCMKAVDAMAKKDMDAADVLLRDASQYKGKWK